jgi:radical SAM protein with 4Fe4S-binding SPASM domain
MSLPALILSKIARVGRYIRKRIRYEDEDVVSLRYSLLRPFGPVELCRVRFQPRWYKHLKRYNHAINDLERRLGVTDLVSFPTTLRIGVTNRCNLRCIICGLSREQRRKDVSDMDMDTYTTLAEEVFPWLERVEFNQNGEALLLEQFASMLELADQYGVVSTISTNGMLLDDAWIDRLLSREHLGTLVVSMDGARKKTLEAIRVGARYDTLIDVMRKLSTQRAGRGLDRPTLEIHCALMRSNIEQLAELVQLAGVVGFDRVSCDYVLIDDWMDPDESLVFHKDSATEQMDLASKVARKEGVELWLPPRFDATSPKDRSNCVLPWNFPSIEPDGTVFPCCILWDRESESLGRVEGSFTHVWNLQRFQQLRQSFVDNEPLFEKCRTCNFHKTGYAITDPRYHMTVRAYEKWNDTSSYEG